MYPYGKAPPLPILNPGSHSARPNPVVRPSGLPYGAPPPLIRPPFSSSRPPAPVFSSQRPPNIPFQSTGVNFASSSKRPQKSQTKEKANTMYVGRITDGVSDEIITSLLKTCGSISSWKRVLDVKGNPTDFGFAVFESREGLVRALQFLGQEINEEFAAQGSGIEIPGKISKKLKLTVDESLRFELDLTVPIQDLDDLQAEVSKILNPLKEFQVDDFLNGLGSETPGTSKEIIPPQSQVTPEYDESYDSEKEEKLKKEKREKELVKSFEDREKRWEAHESARKRKAERDQIKEKDWKARKKILTIKYAEYDDDIEIQKEEFYFDREKWIIRRMGFRQREIDMDEKDRKAEAYEIEHPSETLMAESDHDLEDRIQDESPDNVGRIMTVEERKKAITSIVERIPTEKKMLWNWEMKWQYVDEGLISDRLNNFINKKIIEYMGEEDKSVLDFVAELLLKKTAPATLAEKLLLDEDAEIFVIKLWRMLIFEVESRHERIS